MAKHFTLTISFPPDRFTFARKTDAIAAEAALDGFYVVRTSVPAAYSGRCRDRARLQIASPLSSAPSARSKPSICRSGRSITG